MRKILDTTITYNANQDPVRMVFSNGVGTDYTYDGDRLWLPGSQTSAGVMDLFDWIRRLVDKKNREWWPA